MGPLQPQHPRPGSSSIAHVQSSSSSSLLKQHKRFRLPKRDTPEEKSSPRGLCKPATQAPLDMAQGMASGNKGIPTRENELRWAGGCEFVFTSSGKYLIRQMSNSLFAICRGESTAIISPLDKHVTLHGQRCQAMPKDREQGQQKGGILRSAKRQREERG